MLIAGVHDRDLPLRRMSIAGMEGGGLDSLILSKDMSGPATRLIAFPAGWGSGVPGAFTADVEILVLRGEISLGGVVLGEKDYAAVSAGGVIPRFRATAPGRALLITSAPIRYDTAGGGGPAKQTVTRFGDVDWAPQPGHEGRFTKTLRSAPDADVWLCGSLEWDGSSGPWHRHASAEECYVIDGEITISELTDDGPVVHTYGPGGYIWRPPGSLHAGPGSGAPNTALTFHRCEGGLVETEWVADDSGYESSVD